MQSYGAELIDVPEGKAPERSWTTQKAHIVFFLLDDAGWNDFGYNSVDLETATPSIDKLAQSGIKLPNYYTQPSCTPARASLMTGQYPITIGFQHECIQVGSKWGLPVEIPTMAEMLKDGGYHTAMIGKWDLGHFSEQLWPTHRGFDSYVGITNHGLSNYETYQNAGWSDIHRDLSPAYDANGTYSTTFFLREALDVLDNHTSFHNGEPLFLYMAFNAIHDTLSVPGYFEEASVYARLTENLTDDGRMRAAGAMYLADSAIGEIVSKTMDLGMYDNTVFVCASDNGASPADGGNNWPLRGAKKDYYQGGVRVPAFIHSALLDASNGGEYRTYKSLFHVSDWLPTLVHGVAGLSTPDQTFDGVNQWVAMMDGVAYTKYAPRTEILHNIDYIDSDTGEVFTDATMSNAALTAFLDGGLYKIIINFAGDSDGRWYLPFSNKGEWYEPDVAIEVENSGMNYGNETSFLFDLKNDPFERVNLWERAPFQKIKRTLSSKICDYWENKMVDSLFHDDVSGPAKAAMVDVFEANDNFLTWWVEGNPNMTSKYPISALDYKKTKCPFYKFVGDIPTDIISIGSKEPPGTPDEKEDKWSTTHSESASVVDGEFSPN